MRSVVGKQIDWGECCLGELCVRSGNSYGLKRGIPWQFIFGFSQNLLLLCLTVVSNKSYNGTRSDQFSEQHKLGLASVSWEKCVSDRGADPA